MIWGIIIEPCPNVSDVARQPFIEAAGDVKGAKRKYCTSASHVTRDSSGKRRPGLDDKVFHRTPVGDDNIMSYLDIMRQAWELNFKEPFLPEDPLYIIMLCNNYDMRTYIYMYVSN